MGKETFFAKLKTSKGERFYEERIDYNHYNSDICYNWNCITQKYTKKCVSETTSQLEELKKNALDGEKDHNELAKMAQDIYEQWIKKNEGLSYYLEHDELEKVHTQIRKAEACFEADEVQNAIPEIEDGIFILEHIQEKQSFKLKTIF